MTVSSPIVVDVRVSATDIERYLSAEGSQLRSLRALALCAPASWRISLLAAVGGTSLTLSCDKHFDGASLLDGRIPELLFGDSIELGGEDGTVVFDDPIGQLRDERLLGLGGSSAVCDRITVHRYFDGVLDPRWMRRSAIQETLDRETWDGSLRYHESPYTLGVKCLGHDFAWSPGVISPAGERHKIYLGPQQVTVLERPGKRVDVRHERYGVLSGLDGLEPLRRAIRHPGIAGCLIELPASFPVEIGPLGALVPSQRLDELVGELAAAAGRHAVLQKIGAEATKRRRMTEAADLNLRIASAKAARRVTFDGVEVGSEPTGEYGLVALVHKIEALGGIPLPTYSTVAWTNARGIDALGTVQMDPGEPRHEFAFIEFEYELDNFFHHDHSLAHVELIVCWRLGKSSRALSPRVAQWLWDLDVDGEVVPVIQVSELPRLSIGPRG